MKIVIFSKTSGDSEGIKKKALLFFKEGINKNHEIIYYDNLNTINCDVCVMLSFFNKFKKNEGTLKYREYIYNNNKSKKWIF